MKFANNWIRPITLAAGQTSVALDLPDGAYTLTIADSETAAEKWEIVTATVVAGAAELLRAQEGTEDSDWGAGSVVYCTFTAGIIQGLFSRLDALGARLDELEALVSGRLTFEIVSGVPSYADTISGWIDGLAGALVSAPSKLGGVAVSFDAIAIEAMDGAAALMISGSASGDIGGLAFTLDAPGFEGVSVVVEQVPGEPAFGIVAGPVMPGQLWPDGAVTVTLTPV